MLWQRPRAWFILALGLALLGWLADAYARRERIEKASYYSDRYHGRPTASGEPFDMEAMTAAHRTLPFGTMVRVTSLENGREVEVRINDRGPFVTGRDIDLSLGAARRLDMIRAGVVRVRLEVLGAGRAISARD